MWRPIETRPESEIVDVLFDPESTDDAEFYCPSGKVTGTWRLCHVYFEDGKWWSSDGLDAMQKRPIRLKLTHWMHVPLSPTLPCIKCGAPEEDHQANYYCTTYTPQKHK
jgi:hypothetical protein